MHKLAALAALAALTLSMAASAAEYAGTDVGDAFAIAQQPPYAMILSHGECKIGDSVIPGDVQLTLIDTSTHDVKRGCLAGKDGAIFALFPTDDGQVAIFNITGMPFKRFEYI